MAAPTRAVTESGSQATKERGGEPEKKKWDVRNHNFHLFRPLLLLPFGRAFWNISTAKSKKIPRRRGTRQWQSRRWPPAITSNVLNMNRSNKKKHFKLSTNFLLNSVLAANVNQVQPSPTYQVPPSPTIQVPPSPTEQVPPNKSHRTSPTKSHLPSPTKSHLPSPTKSHQVPLTKSHQVPQVKSHQ